jgi:hypothetical protein
MRNKIITIGILTLFLFGYYQVSAQKLRVQEITIPIDMSTQRPIVDVMIDGKGPYKFIFDTGSTTNVIDESLQEKFGFVVVGEDPLRTPGSENRLASKRVAVPNVNFPGTNITKDVEMNIIALKAMLPVDGILGGFFLEEYLLTINYPDSKLTLAIGELNKGDKDVISFIQDARSINLNIDVAGNKAEAHLDSGNPYSISLPYSLRDKLNYKKAPKKGLPMRTPVATFESWEAELDGDITIGNAVFKNPVVRLTKGLEYVNLGYAVINELSITIDRKNNLIRLERFAEVPSGNKITKEFNQKGSQTSALEGTYEGDRKIWLNESGKLVYQRTPAPMALELVLMEKDLYEIKIPTGVFSPQEMPKVLFIKNEKEEVTAIELVYKARKDGPFKRIVD